MAADQRRSERGLLIPDAALELRFARSGGPGGQHVNTSDTKVTVTVDLNLIDGPPAALRRVKAALGDELTVTAQDSRSQHRNCQLAIARAIETIDRAAAPVARRVPSRPSRAAKARRVDAKIRRGRLKQERRRPDDE